MLIRYLSPRYGFVVAVLLVLWLSGCGAASSNRISSNEPPGTAIISFANTVDHVGTTTLGSDFSSQQAGVNGRALSVSTKDMQLSVVQLTLDTDGNMGLRGSYHSLSSKRMKKDVRALAADPVGLLERTRIVTFRYNWEPETSAPHVGIIAEDAPVPMTNVGHDSFDLNNSLAVTIAAERQLNKRIHVLEARLARLEAASYTNHH